MLPGGRTLRSKAVDKAPSCATQSLYIALSRFIGQSVAPRNILIPSRQGLRVLERLRRLCGHIGTPCPPSLPLPLWLQAKRQGTGWGAVGMYWKISAFSPEFSPERSKKRLRTLFRFPSPFPFLCLRTWWRFSLFVSPFDAKIFPRLLPRFRSRCCFLGGFLGGYRKGSASPLSSPLARLHPGSCQAAHLASMEGSTHKRT